MKMKKFLAILLSLTFVMSAMPTITMGAPTVTEFLNIATGADYTLSLEPAYQYSDSGGELTDGKIGSVAFSDSAWVGHQGSDKFEVTVDLGEVKEFRGAKAHFLCTSSGGVIGPAGLEVYYSVDGTEWNLLGAKNDSTKHIGPNDGSGYHEDIDVISVEADAPVEGQYVRFKLLRHDGSAWCFVGEVEVYADILSKPKAPVVNEGEYFSSIFYVREGEDYTLEVEGVPQDLGDLSYQWYKNEQPVGDNSPVYTIENVSLSDNGSAYWCVVTNTLNGMTATKQSKMSMMSVVKSSLNADFPVFDTNLPESTSFVAGDDLVLKVNSSVTDGGKLSYQWYKNGEKIGTNSNTLTIKDSVLADSGEYKVIVTNTKNNLKRRTESIICDVTIEPYYGENLIGSVVYDFNMDMDDAFCEGFEDESRTKLTDGVKTEDIDDKANVAFTDDYGATELTFVMDGVKTVREIQFGAYSKESENISTPTFMQIFAYIDYQWVSIFKGDLPKKDDKGNFVLTFDGKSLDTSALRFAFSNYGEKLVMDEIAVYEVTTGLAPDAYMTDIVNNNIALGRAYEKSQKTGGSYTDKNNAELTDGKICDYDSFYDDRWMGFQSHEEVSFTFDLGYGSKFEEVVVHTAQLGSGIELPAGFRVEVSDDNKEWKTVSNTTFAETTGKFIHAARATYGEPVECRYVKVTVLKGRKSSWIFLSEIEIFEKTSDSVGLEANNVSYGKSYTASSVSAEKPDNVNIKKLTDGHSFAMDKVSDTWVGFDGSTEIVMDLGTSRAFEQVAARFFENALPDKVSVYTSDNNSDWTFIEEKDVTSSNFDIPFSEMKTARYVKFVIESDSFFMADELKVFEYIAVFPEQAPEAFYRDDNNIALDKEYVSSKEASASYYDSGKELTNGLRASYLYTDSAWVAYPANGEEEISVTVDLGEVKSFEQVQVGMLKSSAKNYKVYYPYELLIEYSEDGENYEVYADELIKYYEGDEIKRENYFGNAEGRFVRFTFTTNGTLFLDEIAVFEKLVDGVDYEIDPDKGASFNLSRGKLYETSRKADYRSVNGILTDGLLGNTGTKFDKNWTGFNRSGTGDDTIGVVIDLEEFYSITDVVVSSLNNDASGVTTPKNLKVYGSNDGVAWMYMGDIAENAATGAVELTWTGDAPVYAKHIKVTFETPYDDNFVYLDEIRVIGKRGKCSDAKDVVVSGALYNLAAGRDYIISPKQINAQSDDGKKLTDGILGTTRDDTDPAWVLFTENATLTGVASDGATLQSITVPLCDEGEEAKYVTKIETRFNSMSFGGAAEYPWCIWTYASMDGINWYPLSDKDWDVSGRVWWGGVITSGWRSAGRDLVDKSVTAVKAKYVRVDFEILRNSMVDEVTVYGYDEPIEGFIEIPEEKCRKIGDPGDVHNLDNHGYYYQKPGESTDGIRDMVLCYNGWSFDKENQENDQSWNADLFRPYLTYLDRDGVAQDKMYDAICLLAITSKSGRCFHSSVGNAYEPLQFSDWEWYLDRLFKEGGDVDELNKAAKRASEELGDPNYKVKLTIMHPGVDPNYTPTKFGPIDGKYYNFTNDKEGDGWKFANSWYIDAVLGGMFEDAEYTIPKYEYIDFSGFYWFDEQIGFKEKYVLYNAEEVHKRGFKLYWIPFNYANGNYFPWDFGFDAVALQPNHFFGDHFEPGNQSELGNDWMDKVAYQCSYAQIGLEMEFDGRVMTDVRRYNLLLDYLNGATRNGMDGSNCYRNWYVGTLHVRDLAYSKVPAIRNLYDYCYQFMNGTYEPKPFIEYFTDISGETNNAEHGTYGESTAPGNGGAYYKEEVKPVIGEPTKVPETGNTGSSYADYDWVSENGVYRYQDDKGNYATGWVKVANTWYYFKSNGTMATGWIKDGNKWYYLKSNGAMATGWLKDAGKWYYLNASGAMANNQWVYDNGWYYMRGNGEMLTGWLKDGNSWYYLNASGLMVTDWNLISGDYYYFYSDGRMAADETVNGYKVNASGVWVK